jgi:hypothetical protein
MTASHARKDNSASPGDVEITAYGAHFICSREELGQFFSLLIDIQAIWRSGRHLKLLFEVEIREIISHRFDENSIIFLTSQVASFYLSGKPPL